MMPPALPGVDPAQARRFGGVVERYYGQVDAWVGRVLRGLGPDDRLVIVSDHGFTWGERRPHVLSGAHTPTAVMWHHPEGSFLVYGRGIEPTPTRQRLQVLDVAPTLLALAGLPPGAEMPGKVPSWLSVERSSPRVSYAALLPRRAPASVELPPEAREEELAKLRALGYLAGGSTPAPAAAPQAPAPQAPPSVPQFDRAEARRLNNLGSSRGEAGDARGAEEAFRQAVNADPSYAPSHYNLALLLRKQGRYDESDRAFWRSVDTGIRERETAVVQSALDYSTRNETARAKATFAEGRRRFPDSPTIWLNAGVFLGQLGDREEARRCLERAVQLAPDNPMAHSNLATALYGQGDTEGARRHLARAVELDPANQQLRQQLTALGGPPGP
jgi:tetratricopeptide (TPR) repeat protein